MEAYGSSVRVKLKGSVRPDEKTGRLKVSDVKIHKVPVQEDGIWTQEDLYTFEGMDFERAPATMADFAAKHVALSTDPASGFVAWLTVHTDRFKALVEKLKLKQPESGIARSPAEARVAADQVALSSRFAAPGPNRFADLATEAGIGGGWNGHVTTARRPRRAGRRASASGSPSPPAWPPGGARAWARPFSVSG